ncbi:hypothetical protein BB560_003621, partial [Smittium megazygosporum]
NCPLLSDVSQPTDFHHQVHVDFDPKSGNFIGLPTQWSKLLETSNITKQDYVENPEAVLNVLEFYTKNNEENDNLSSQTDYDSSELSDAVSPYSKSPSISPSSSRLDLGSPAPKPPPRTDDSENLLFNSKPTVAKSSTNSSLLSPGNVPSQNAPSSPPHIKAIKQNIKKLSSHFKTSSSGPQKSKANNHVSKAMASLTAKSDSYISTKKKDDERRISTLSEPQIMSKLREISSKQDPKIVYTKIKKIGQG